MNASQTTTTEIRPEDVAALLLEDLKLAWQHLTPKGQFALTACAYTLQAEVETPEYLQPLDNNAGREA